MKNDIRVISFLQLRLRFIIYLRKIVTNYVENIYVNIQSVMYRSIKNYKNNIINFYSYNEINNKLQKLKINYKELLSLNKTLKKLVLINSINSELKNICNLIGVKKTEDIFSIYYNKHLNQLFTDIKIQKIINFIDKYNIRKYKELTQKKSKIIDWANNTNYDHCESYFTKDKKYVLITSPYYPSLSKTQYFVDLGFVKYNNLYSNDAVTFLLVME